MIALLVMLNCLSCYVGCARMKDETKTAYFLAVGVCLGLYVFVKVLSSL